MGDVNFTSLVDLYGKWLRAVSERMRTYWNGRIDEFIAQNGIDRRDAVAALREARTEHQWNV